MEWIALSERTADELDKASKVVSLLETSSDLLTVYEERRWGLFKRQGTASFYKALTDMERRREFIDPEDWICKEESISDQNVAEDEDYDLEYEDKLEADDRDLRSLDWVTKRARSDSTRRKAKALYQQRLLELYISHVEHTGETYYPQLRKELLIQYCDENNISMPEQS